ncbi:hypothetical protein [Micromonospora sp. LOL_023]|uniref:hypothetical protein n=1 Tax=Micromonospora sp. LOL_023 TaxID=3345418 RepID=UPI003A89FE0B
MTDRIRGGRDAPRRPGRSLAATLADLYRSRGMLLGLLAITLGIILILVSPAPGPSITTDAAGGITVTNPTGLLARLRLYDIGVALFQTGLVITVFQVLLNQIAEDRFVEQVRWTMREHEGSVRSAVAASLAASQSLDGLNLAPAELDRVIENAARLRTGSPELGAVIARKLRTGVFESRELWRNLVVRAEIYRVDSATSSGRKFDYYDVYFQFGYHTTNVSRTRFAFKVARWQDEYDRFLRAEEMGAVWRLPSTGEFDDDWSAGFELLAVNFGGQSVEFQRNDAEREYVAHAPVDDFADRSDVFVQYSFNAKVLADGNLLSFEVPKPTFAATYSVSVAVDDVERVRALDFFGSTRPASVEYAPSLQTTRFVGVSVDDWILPKAGMVVVWKRRPESHR